MYENEDQILVQEEGYAGLANWLNLYLLFYKVHHG